MRQIDLRSDTVTKPTPEMRRAMAEAPVGDNVYDEDPTVLLLEERVATMLGKERALFVPTGVMSNQLCLKVLTNPGDEVILGEDSHIFNYETGAPALLSGVQLHTIPNPAGDMHVDDVDQAIREDAYYLPRTSVIAIEQTHNRAGGTVIPMESITKIADLARGRGIALHLDGARLWNACVASKISPRAFAEQFETVSVCLSKGLGAPIGSVMTGSARHIEMAWRFRKIWGGGWRQAGILAAAGLYALDNNIERLAEDHEKAAEFGRIIGVDGPVRLASEPETNIVILLLDGIETNAFAERLGSHGVQVSAAFKGKLRAVFHMDVTMEDAREAARLVVEEGARVKGEG